MRFICYFIITIFFFKQSQAIDTVAKQAILYDLETESIIFKKDSDKLMSPSSMSKIMTIYYVFKKISDGELTLKMSLKLVRSLKKVVQKCL